MDHLETSGPEALIGESCGNYRLVELIGQGGMGFVYRAAHQTVSDLNVAVKLLRPELSSQRELVYRFFNEARASAALSHSAVVKVFDCGFLGAHAYLVMELLKGQPLSRLLQRSGLLAPRLLTWLSCEMARALAAVHEAQIVHRDLKPDNVFLTADPTVEMSGTVRLLDFGIAKLLQDDASGSLRTRPGSLLGTPLYMSPEQCKGGTTIVDHRTDIYSLGCMMFEMACGRPPFAPSGGAGAMIAAHVYEPPPAPRSLAPSLPAKLDALIVRMLEKDPARRPQTMGEVLATLEPGRSPARAGDTLVLGDPGDPAPAPWQPLTSLVQSAPRTTFTSRALESPRLPRRWSPVRWAMALLAMAGLAGAVVWSARPHEPAGAPAAEPAPAERAENAPIEIAAPPPAPAPPIPASTAPPVTHVQPPPTPARTPRSRAPAARPRETAPASAPARPAVVATEVVRVQSSPPGARVCLADSGQSLGITPFNLDPNLPGLQAGLVFEKDGHRSVEVARPSQATVHLRALAPDDLEDPRVCRP